jgi:hypothetical protein
MSNMTMMPNDEQRPDVDVLLHDYFQSELPRPWPTFQAPKQTRVKQPETVFARYSGRIVLAAGIALLLAGYLTVAGYFPARQGADGLEDVTGQIGSKDSPSKSKRPLPPGKADHQQNDHLEPMGDAQPSNRRPD